MENKKPVILYCRKEEKEIYDLLAEEEIFKNMDLKHIFMMSMIIGYRENKRNKLDKRHPSGLIRVEFLNDTEKSIIKSIAVATEKTLDALLDKKRVYSLAEEYASGGLKLLKNTVCTGEFGSYVKKLGVDLIEEVKRAQKSDQK